MWNYRVVRVKGTKFLGGKPFPYDFLEIKEVYYDEEGNPNGFGDAGAPRGDDQEELYSAWSMYGDAFSKPVLGVNEEGNIVQMQ